MKNFIQNSDMITITAPVGVFDLPKAPAVIIGEGDRVAWDDIAKQVALPGAGLFPVDIP